MTELSVSLRHWLTFAGIVLVVAVLYWAQAILVPVALAAILTFVLTPPVLKLQRWLGRVVAVLVVVGLVFSALGAAGWAISRQMSNLSSDLIMYRQNIRQKVRDVRGAGKDSSVEKLQTTLSEIKKDIGVPDPPKGTVADPVVVQSDTVAGVSAFSWLGPIIEPAGTAGFVIVLVLFMLLEREELRDRLIGLIGHGHLTRTTKALDEAGRRVSRQLLLQSVVNLTYGALSAAGLYFLGVPYALFWGAAGAGLRFIPYVGPIIAAAGPIALSLAALPGWTGPLETAAYFLALELFTNLVLETVLYAGAAGVSQVALLIAVAFWTWLWGPLGLLMATPLTVCLVVLGRHVPGLRFVATLMADEPALSPEFGYYQRLLARDVGEAADVIERFVKTAPPETVYDALMIPALNYAERDRLDGSLTVEDEEAIGASTRELIRDLVPSASAAPAAPESATRLRVLGYAVHGSADRVALDMLETLLASTAVSLDCSGPGLLASDVVRQVQAEGVGVVCLADLPPSSSSKSRYLVKRLRAACPDLKIVVGRWAAGSLADDSLTPLLDAGATHATSSLLETRRLLVSLAQAGRPDGTQQPHAA